MEIMIYAIFGLLALGGVVYKARRIEKKTFTRVIFVNIFIYMSIPFGIMVCGRFGKFENEIKNMLYGYYLFVPLVVVVVSLFAFIAMVVVCGKAMKMSVAYSLSIFVALSTSLVISSVLNPTIAAMIYSCMLFCCIGGLNALCSPVLSSYLFASAVAMLFGFGSGLTPIDGWLSVLDMMEISSTYVKILVMVVLGVAGSVDCLVWIRGEG